MSEPSEIRIAEFGTVNQEECNALEKLTNEWVSNHPDGYAIELHENSGSGFTPVPTHDGDRPTKRRLFSYSGQGAYVGFGFKMDSDPKWDTEKAAKELAHVALDNLPIRDLDYPGHWDIGPRTPISSFIEGVTLEHFDGKRIVMSIKTRGYCVRGSQNNLPMIGCGSSPKGSYFHIEKDIPISVKIDLPLTFQD